MKRIAGVVLGLWFLSSCAGGGEVSGNRRVVDDAQIVFTVTPASVQVGKAVRFVIRVTNNGGRTRVLHFASGQLYDFWVTDGEREVWRWSDGRAFSQALEQRSVATQDTLTLAESWTASRSGDLVAHGILMAEGFERELTGKVTVGG